MLLRFTGLIAVLGALYSSAAFGLGLGELNLRSSLNEPMDADITLLNIGNLNSSQVIVRLADDADFRRAGVDKEEVLTGLQFSVETTGRNQGRIAITSRDPILEPYLDFIVEVRWPSGRLLREYTVLLDLPVFSETAPAATASPVRSGNLEPAPSTPQPRPAPRPSRPEPESSSYSGGSTFGRTQNGDTLWNIALKVRPSRAFTVQQTMLAIQRLNPDAFFNGNINRLKSGYVLRVPSADDIASLSTDQAVQEVAQHNRAWRSGDALATQLQTGRTQRSDSSQTQTDSGQLSLVSGRTESGGRVSRSGSGSDDLLADDLSRALENLEVSQRQNSELRSRLDSLEEQLGTLQRLIELKDNQLASLQTGETMPAGSTTTIDSGAATGGDDAGTETDSGAETQAQAEPKPAPAPAPAPKPEPGFLDTYLIPLVVVVLGAVVGVFLFLWKKRRDEDDDGAAEDLVEEEFEEQADLGDQDLDDLGELGDLDEFDEAEEPVAEEEEAAEAEPEPEKPSAQSVTGDAISEADIYIAYGRFDQATDLLQTAISAEPGRTDLRLKLLEVFVEEGNKDGFQEQYLQLESMGDDQAIIAAKELLSTVDGVADWLDDLPESGAAGSEMDSIDEDMGDFAAELESEGFDLGLDDSPAEAPADDSMEDLDLEAELGSLDDLDGLEDGLMSDGDDDLGLEDPSLEDSLDGDFDLELEEELDSPAAPLAEEDDLLSLEDDLDLDESMDLDLELETGSEDDSADALEDLDDLGDLGDLGELEIDEDGADSLELEAETAAVDDDDGFDFDLDDMEVEEESAEPAAELEMGDDLLSLEDELDLDGGEDDLDLADSALETAEEELSELSASEPAVDLEGEADLSLDAMESDEDDFDLGEELEADLGDLDMDLEGELDIEAELAPDDELNLDMPEEDFDLGDEAAAELDLALEPESTDDAEAADATPDADEEMSFDLETESESTDIEEASALESDAIDSELELTTDSSEESDAALDDLLEQMDEDVDADIDLEEEFGELQAPVEDTEPETQESDASEAPEADDAFESLEDEEVDFGELANETDDAFDADSLELEAEAEADSLEDLATSEDFSEMSLDSLDEPETGAGDAEPVAEAPTEINFDNLELEEGEDDLEFDLAEVEASSDTDAQAADPLDELESMVDELESEVAKSGTPEEADELSLDGVDDFDMADLDTVNEESAATDEANDDLGESFDGTDVTGLAAAVGLLPEDDSPTEIRQPEPAPAPEPADEPQIEPEIAIDGGEDEDDFDFLSDSDEVATKLDLARAYIDMGDADGARDILDEVMDEGNAEQKAEAEELLGRI